MKAQNDSSEHLFQQCCEMLWVQRLGNEHCKILCDMAKRSFISGLDEDLVLGETSSVFINCYIIIQTDPKDFGIVPYLLER